MRDRAFTALIILTGLLTVALLAMLLFASEGWVFVSGGTSLLCAVVTGVEQTGC